MRANPKKILSIIVRQEKNEVLTYYKSTLFSGFQFHKTRPSGKSKNCRELGRSTANTKKRSAGVAGVLTVTLNNIKWRTSGAQAREFIAVFALGRSRAQEHDGQALSAYDDEGRRFPLSRG